MLRDRSAASRASPSTRFTEAERDLIRLHERAHIQRGDPRANLLVAAVQASAWFKPIAHLAARCARLDQELACDALAMERRPGMRRHYAEALLKAQLSAGGAPVACSWAGLARRHPLELRVRRLRIGPPSERSRASGLLFGVALTGAASVTVLLVAPHMPS